MKAIVAYVLLICCSLSFGLLAAAGVFTVLVAVGLIPRFAGKTHTAGHIILYENMVVSGTIVGCILSVFREYCAFGAFWQSAFPDAISLFTTLGQAVLAVFGLFSGMFVGCLALAIAEMLDSIPIFARRISFRHGIGLAILSIAAGKLTGSLFYFINELHRTV